MINQKGFTLVGGLLVAATLCVVGFAGYSVWSEQQEEEPKHEEMAHVEPLAEAVQQKGTAGETLDDSGSKVPAGWLAFSDEQYGIAFYYPEGWSIETRSNDATIHEVWYLITSPDYTVDEDDFFRTIRGGQIELSITDLKKFPSSISKDTILDGTAIANTKETYKDISEIVIDGNDGIRYSAFYEGPGITSSSFVLDSIEYDFRIEAGSNFLDIYNKIIESFSLL